MAELRVEKVVASPPDPLEPDTIYYVRAGQGFDLYVTDATGVVAHSLNGRQQTAYDGGAAVTVLALDDAKLDGGSAATLYGPNDTYIDGGGAA